MIIKNNVYDVTDFLPVRVNIDLRACLLTHSAGQEHPGGAKIILKYAGKDATSAYEPIHPPDALEKNLPREKHLGPIASEDAQKLKKASDERKKTQDELRMEKAEKEKPPPSRIINYQELEDVARSVLSYKAYAYYASAGDDEISESNAVSLIVISDQFASSS